MRLTSPSLQDGFKISAAHLYPPLQSIVHLFCLDSRESNW
jgi:hypothetical protein